MVKKYIRWTLALLIEDAKPHLHRDSWRQHSPNAYKTALKRGVDDVCCAHMIPKVRRTFNSVLVTALLFEKYQDWRLACSSDYFLSSQNKWIPSIKSRLKKTVRAEYWTFERCLKEAQKHKHIVDWRAASPASYSKAGKRRWKKRCIAHMSPSRVSKWTLSACIRAARQYPTLTSWAKGSKQSYLIAKDKPEWRAACTKHMSKRVTKFRPTRKVCANDALRFKYIEDWQESSPEIFRYARERGWELYCSQHMIPKGLRWTLAMCLYTSSKYESLLQWEKQSPDSFNAAAENDWINQCEQQMHSYKDSTYVEGAKEMVQMASPKAFAQLMSAW